MASLPRWLNDVRLECARRKEQFANRPDTGRAVVEPKDPPWKRQPVLDPQDDRLPAWASTVDDVVREASRSKGTSAAC